MSEDQARDELAEKGVFLSAQETATIYGTGTVDDRGNPEPQPTPAEQAERVESAAAALSLDMGLPSEPESTRYPATGGGVPQLEGQVCRDPWAHRSKGMKCATCMWFVCKTVVSDKGIMAMMEKTTWIGRCRKHAPTLGGYPVVFTTDWCGDHKLNAEAV